MATDVLIPGAGGDPWDWHRLVPELEARGHWTIAIRLPAADDRAGWSEYADAVIEAIGSHEDVILVAESMGGFTAPIVAARRAVRGIVLVNGMIPRPGETFGEWWAATGSGEARRAYHATLGLTAEEASSDEVIYYHDLSADLRAEALARPEAGQSDAPLEQPWPLAAWPDVPTRAIAGTLDRMFPFEFQRRIARERLGLDVEPIEGGHMVALSHPGALAELIVSRQS